MSYRRLKRGLVRMAGPLGGYRIVNGALKRSPRIFMYHRFAEHPVPRKLALAAFEAHLRVLAREFDTMTMAELVRHVRANGEAPPHAAVITVDDGHRDFVDLAVPLLQRYGVKATLYATTRFVAGGFWLWPDRLEYALLHSREPALDLGCEGRWPLEDEAARWRAWDALIDRCTRMPNDAKEALLAQAISALNVVMPEAPAPAYEALSVEELRRLASEGFEIGAHTRTHPILSRVPDSSLPEEIDGAKRDLEAWLQTEVVSFCYPNGAPADFDDTVKRHVAAAGFDSAVAAYFRHDVLADLYEIKRLSCGNDQFQFQRNAYGVENLSSILQHRLGI